jgi:glycosyltransferase involved in cell wall biosynthesis
VIDSFYEGGPIVNMEALAAGLPVVTSDIGAAREQVGDDGTRGYVVSNPLGDAARVDWDTIRRARYADQPNRRELVTAMRSVIDGRAAWSARRDELARESSERFRGEPASLAYAAVLRRAAGRPEVDVHAEPLPPLSWHAPMAGQR